MVHVALDAHPGIVVGKLHIGGRGKGVDGHGAADGLVTIVGIVVRNWATVLIYRNRPLVALGKPGEAPCGSVGDVVEFLASAAVAHVGDDFADELLVEPDFRIFDRPFETQVEILFGQTARGEQVVDPSVRCAEDVDRHAEVGAQAVPEVFGATPQLGLQGEFLRLERMRLVAQVHRHGRNVDIGVSRGETATHGTAPTASEFISALPFLGVVDHLNFLAKVGIRIPS